MAFIKLVFWFLVVFVILLFVQTYRVQHDTLESQFVKGTVPTPTLNGTYYGTFASFHMSFWNGKRFDAKDHVGVNQLFGRDHIPFKTSVSNGLWDKTTKVLQLDYNIPHNFILFHPVLDEVVQVKPGQYLGKVEVRVVPGFPFALGYFWLKK